MPKPLSLMPGPKIYPIVGSVLEYSKHGKYSFERMHVAKRDNLEKYGKIYREKMGRNIVQLFDPVDIEVVQRAEGKYPNRPGFPLLQVANKRDGKPLGLGSLNGEGWWTLRSAAQQSMMRPDAALPYLPLQNHVADQFLALLDHLLRHSNTFNHGSSASCNADQSPGSSNQKSEQRIDPATSGSGVIPDILPLLTKYTTEAFGTVCFKAKIGCLEPDSRNAQSSPSPQNSQQSSTSGLNVTGSRSESGCPDVAVRLMSATNKMFGCVQQTTFSFPSYAFWRTKIYKDFIESYNNCYSIAKNYVVEALSAGGGTSAPLKAGEKGDEPWRTCPNFLERLMMENSGRLSQDEIVLLAVDLFTAGIDSTANAIAFCLYNLGKNPDKQERVIEELDKILPAGSPVTPQTLVELRYLHACVKESFRLNFPVEGGAVRELEKDLVLSDFLVPKGTLIAFNYQTMCLLEEYFPKPYDFIPERWLRADRQSNQESFESGQLQSTYATKTQAKTFSFLPFGHGSRMCIGRRFALQELNLAVIKILQKYRITCTESSQDVGMLNRVFTMPDRPVSLYFQRRKTQFISGMKN